MSSWESHFLCHPEGAILYVIPTVVEGSPAVGSMPFGLDDLLRHWCQSEEILRLRSG